MCRDLEDTVEAAFALIRVQTQTLVALHATKPHPDAYQRLGSAGAAVLLRMRFHSLRARANRSARCLACAGRYAAERPTTPMRQALLEATEAEAGFAPAAPTAPTAPLNNRP